VHAAYKQLAGELVADPDAPLTTPSMKYFYDKDTTPPTLSVANRIWGEQSLTWDSKFLSTLRDDYAAPAEITHIRSRPGEIVEEVNSWVEGKTNHMIKHLLTPQDVTADSLMVLVNAVHFIAGWTTPFEKYNTVDGTFTTMEGVDATARMMAQRKHFDYAEVAGGGVQLLRLPYGRGEASMLLLLPRDPKLLPELAASLGPATVAEWSAGMRRVEVDVRLPRFELSYRADLAQQLQRMGMPLAFSRAADFSGMSPQALDAGLRISEVIHGAKVKVTEDGTEAAAATAVVMMRSASFGGPPPPEPKVFHADRPFLFLIQHRSGTLLFAGRVADPAAH